MIRASDARRYARFHLCRLAALRMIPYGAATRAKRKHAPGLLEMRSPGLSRRVLRDKERRRSRDEATSMLAGLTAGRLKSAGRSKAMVSDTGILMDEPPAKLTGTISNS